MRLPMHLVAKSMGFVFFSLAVVVLALSARSETGSAFNREILKNRHQLMLYGISLLMILSTAQPGFSQEIPGLDQSNTESMADLHRCLPLSCCWWTK